MKLRKFWSVGSECPWGTVLALLCTPNLQWRLEHQLLYGNSRLRRTARDRERDRDREQDGYNGFLYYSMYCTHYTGTGQLLFSIVPITVPVPCSVNEPLGWWLTWNGYLFTEIFGLIRHSFSSCCSDKDIIYLTVIFCRMVEARREELAARDIDMGHPISAYHLINFWVTLLDKIQNHPNRKGKSHQV